MSSKFLDQKHLMSCRCSLSLPPTYTRPRSADSETRSSRTALSLDRPRVTCNWHYTITENYIKCKNKDLIVTDGLSPLYLKIPCLRHILRHHIPNYRFSSAGYQTKMFECMFLVFGNSRKGKTWFEPIFLRDSNQDVSFCLSDGRRHIFKEKSLIFHIAPLNVYVNREITLRCHQGEPLLTLAQPDCQELLELDGVKNTLLLSGPVLSDPVSGQPFLATNIPEALNSAFAVVNSLPKQRMTVNQIVGRGGNFVRVLLHAAAEQAASLSLTLTSADAVLAFEKNPALGAVFKHGNLFLPLTYQGPPEVVRPFMCKKVHYSNTYSSCVEDMTCLVIGKYTKAPLLIEETEWKPGKPLELLVTNPTRNPVVLTDGFRLGSCVFARIPTVRALPKSLLKKLPGILMFPGNCPVRSTKLERVVKTCHYFNDACVKEYK